MTTFTGKITLLALAAALSASVAAIALAEDKDLIIFEWSGYEVPEFHPGYIEKIGDSPTFHLLRRRGGSLPEDPRRLQG
jgi:putative spermidine/putrescine transport system substrate-binding protein/spermidine/putrescine transport system substrate-binding protein